MMATLVCVNYMLFSVLLLCTQLCTWLCIATSVLIFAYMSSALLLVRATLTRVCWSLLAVACWLCACWSATAALDRYLSTLNYIVMHVCAYISSVLSYPDVCFSLVACFAVVVCA